jgi:hypothetical protein
MWTGMAHGANILLGWAVGWLLLGLLLLGLLLLLLWPAAVFFRVGYF